MTGNDFSFGKMRLSESDVMALPTLIVQIKVRASFLLHLYRRHPFIIYMNNIHLSSFQAHDGVDKSFDPNTIPSLAGDRDSQNPFDVMIAIPATHYLEWIPATGAYRSKITLDSKIGSFIGMVAMEGHAFYYDLTADRIGIAESLNCEANGFLGDDDMFALPTIESGTGPWGYNPNGPGGWGGSYGDRGVGTLSTAHYDQQGANCTSATCISFVTVGYATVLVTLAVAFKKYRPKDRSKKFEESVSDDSDTVFGRESETLNPEFQQHVRNGSVEGLA
jgi:hypothetical protein